jgi:hypothetical protein
VICGTFIRICKYDIAKSNQAANPAAPQTSFTITINAATEVWSTPQDLLPRWNHAAAVRLADTAVCAVTKQLPEVQMMHWQLRYLS